MARLPQPGGDNGAWGDILNDFLGVEHNTDGTLKDTGSLSAKADDTDVVHNSGAEAITGTKTFSASPVVPAPTASGHAATKQYVDTAAGTHSVAVKTSAYIITPADEVILANASGGSFAVTLPTAVGSARAFSVKKTDASASTVTVNTTLGQTIDGGTTAVLRVQYESITVVSDGANWFII
jgi:hypothetical protein